MLVSPQLFSYGRVLEDPMSHKQENLSYFCRERADTLESIDLINSPSLKIRLNDGDFGSNSNDGSLDGDQNVKKRYHNASERDRRKKMNTLYDNLRSLLPPDEQSKKMRIPATLSRVLKYIPELQKEVKRLTQKKESFMSKNSNSKAEKEKTDDHRSSNSAASAFQINEDEVVIQISKPKSKKGSLSEAILRLEDEGFFIKNVSCFESFEGRLFNNLHFQAQEGQVIDAEKLKERVWSLI